MKYLLSIFIFLIVILGYIIYGRYFEGDVNLDIALPLFLLDEVSAQACSSEFGQISCRSVTLNYDNTCVFVNCDNLEGMYISSDRYIMFDRCDKYDKRLFCNVKDSGVQYEIKDSKS